MKTILLRLVMAGVGMALIAFVLSHSLCAQTTISFDSSPGNALVMKIQNEDLSNKSHKFIFIFDSASVSYEFDKNGEIAFFTTDFTGSGVSRYSISATKELVNDPEPDFNSYLINEEIIEEPLELENWMLTPNDWIN